MWLIKSNIIEVEFSGNYSLQCRGCDPVELKLHLKVAAKFNNVIESPMLYYF